MAWLSLSCVVAGQTLTDTNQNLPLFGSVHASNLDVVSLQNGNLHIELPIVTFPQRGSRNIAWSFVYDTLTFQKNWIATPTQQDPRAGHYEIRANTGGWSLNNAFDYSIISASSQQSCSGQTVSVWENWVLTDPRKDGTRIPISGFSSTSREDTNGNVSSPSSDTLGRSMLTVTNAPTITYTSPLGHTVTGPQYSQWTTTDSNGNSEIFRLDYQAVDISTHFCNGSPVQCNELTGIARLLPQQITVPDPNRTVTYQFSWVNDSAAELQQITFPTGSFIGYAYTSHGCPPGDGLTNFLCRQEVISRTMNVDGSASTWTYNNGTVTDPNGNDEVHTFGFVTINNVSSGGQVEKQVQQYAGTGTSRTLLRTVATDYTGEPIFGVLHNIRPIRVTTTLDNGQTSKTETDYDTFAFSTFTVSRMNVKQTREYDFGSGSPGALIRTTTLTYLHEGNSAYIAPNIVDRVASKIVADPSGNPISQTNYSYDTTGLINSGGAFNHDGSYGITNSLRGNVTKASHWINTNNSWQTTTNNYDDLGNLRSSIDPGTHATTFDYTDNWGGNGCVAANTQAYATQQTNALGQNTKTAYFPCTEPGDGTWGNLGTGNLGGNLGTDGMFSCFGN